MKNITKQFLLDFEASVAKEFEQGNINCPVHLSGGNEDELIEIFQSILPDDYVISTHRNHYHYLLKGGNPETLISELKGEKSGCCLGQGRSMHLYDPNINFYTSAIVAGGCAIACGLGLAGKRTFCFIGDGAEDSGHFFEAVRFVEGRNLPVCFVIEDNGLAVESSANDRWGDYKPFYSSDKILRYSYKRIYPHVGIGKFVGF